jgi:hypothetical protein
MGWLFVIVTYISPGPGLWSYGVVPSPYYEDQASCEAARARMTFSNVEGVVTIYPCKYGAYTPVLGVPQDSQPQPKKEVTR